MGKAEAYVEDYLNDTVESLGGECYKFSSGVTGVPDRIIVLDGYTLFVETKARNGVVRKMQKIQIRRILSAGGLACVASTREEVDELIAAVRAGADDELEAIISQRRKKYIDPKRASKVYTAIAV